MSRLPPRPRQLTILPTRLAREQKALALQADTATPSDGLVLFADVFARLGGPAGRRYAAPAVCMFILRELLARSEGPWRARAQDPFAVRAVARAHNEMRLAGIAAGHFAKSKMSPALAAIVAVLAEYERTLDKRALFDDADGEREAVLAVLHGHAALADTTAVHVAGGASLFGSGLDLLAALAAKGVAVDIRLPYDNERRLAFAWPEASLHRLEASGASRIKIRHDDRCGTGPLAALRRAQFGNGAAMGSPVRIIEVTELGDHARAVREIVAGWLRAGVPLHAIAIVAPDLENHRAALVHELAAIGIPTRLPTGPTLATTRAGEALLTGLTLSDCGVPRESLINLWLYLNRWVQTSNGRWSPEGVAHWLRRSGVRSSRVGGYRQHLLGQGQRARGSPRHDDVTTRLVEAIEALIAEVSQVVAGADPGSQFAASDKLAHALLGDGPPAAWSADVLAAELPFVAAVAREREAVQAIYELIGSLAQAALQTEGPSMSRGELVQWLELGLRAQRLRPQGNVAAVAIVQPRDLVEAQFARVVLVGIDADTFPGVVAPDPVLGDDLRAEINAHVGPRLLQYSGLSGRETLQADARDTWLWLETLASANDELVVTVTQPEGNAPTGRSEFVQELMRTLGIASPQRFVPTQRTHECYSSEQPQQRIELERRIVYAQTIDKAPYVLGLLGDGDRERLAAHMFSVVHPTSHLDYLGTCAFRFFAAAILGLRHDDVPSLGADARDQGSLMHAALEIVYADIVSHGGLRVARRDPQAALGHARALLHAAREQMVAEVIIHPLLEPAAIHEAIEAALKIVEIDLDSNEDREPLRLEYRFDDRAGAAAAPLALAASDARRVLHIRGSIDRVDRLANAIEAIDYKRTPSKRADGRHFQLPLYLAVAWRDFGKDAQQVSAAWLGLRDRKRHAAVATATPPEFLQSLRDSLFSRLDRALDGDISPDPEPPAACERCDFGALCRYRVVHSAEGDEP